MRVARLVLCAVLVNLAASVAQARRVEPDLPLLEAIVRGAPIPPHVETPSGRHVLDEEDRAFVRALVRAHVEGDAGPFRAALTAGEAWRVHVALESLLVTRIGARRVDEEFVASFLPDLERLAKHADHRPLAIWAIRTLALTVREGAVRTRAQDSLVVAVVEAGDLGSLRTLAQALEGDPQFPIPAPRREALARLILERLRRVTSEERFDVGVEWRLAAAVATPDLIALARATFEHARTTRPGAADDWLPFLATVRHPDTPALVREALARPRGPGTDGNFLAAFEAAVLHPDPSYIPSFEREHPVWTSRLVRAVVAIDDPSARALLRKWALSSAFETTNDGSSAAWLALEPTAASAWLLEVARDPDFVRRATALSLLAKAGRTDVLESLFQEAARPAQEPLARQVAFFGLAAIVRTLDDPAVRARALALVQHPDHGDIALLEAAYAKEPEAAETRLLEMLARLPAAPQWEHVRVMEGLGRVGGTRSLEALAPWTRWRKPGDPSVFDFHFIARSAIGCIEARLGR